MAKTVNSAFNEFLSDFVNLDSSKTASARSSRDWLIDQIKKFPNDDDSFPKLHPDKRIFFGSFARKTKIRELDDIDIMLILRAEGGKYTDYSDYIEINTGDSVDRLKQFCNSGTTVLNSRKIVNKLVSSLSDVPQYSEAEMHRNQEAATLKLKSYTWNFDIVPCFRTNEESNGRDYYLIPDGNGNWKKTDPRRDRNRLTNINQNHDGNVLNAIRIMKYWNKRRSMPSMSSYLLETMILDYYESAKATQWVDVEVKALLKYIRDNISKPIYDPKDIQGDMNDLSDDTIKKINDKADSDYNKAKEARNYEDNGDHNSSIGKWKEIFGDNFPEYG